VTTTATTKTRAPGETLIRAEGLTVRLGGRLLLDHVDIEVAAGEIVTLIGPNGAGKTTLIRALLGIVAPEAGHITRKPGLRIGYVPQRLHIDPVLPLTVARFLALGHNRRGHNKVDRDMVARVLDEVGIGDKRRAALHALSGGEFQRAVLARALLRDPDLLILDEPVQGVDFAGQLDLYKLVGDLRRERGCGVLMVSHDLHVVMASTDRVVCINRHLCCAGRPEAVSRHPEYIELFGERARELAVYSHTHDHEHDLSGHVLHEHHHHEPHKVSGKS
jgi:zinc transport system ATP-binding protein